MTKNGGMNLVYVINIWTVFVQNVDLHGVSKSALNQLNNTNSGIS